MAVFTAADDEGVAEVAPVEESLCFFADGFSVCDGFFLGFSEGVEVGAAGLGFFAYVTKY